MLSGYSEITAEIFRYPRLLLATQRFSNRLSQNSGQHVIGKMPQVLTVGAESLAAGFATGNNYARTAECNRRLPFDERASNMPLKFGIR